MLGSQTPRLGRETLRLGRTGHRGGRASLEYLEEDFRLFETFLRPLTIPPITKTEPGQLLHPSTWLARAGREIH